VDVDVAPAISWLESGSHPPWSEVEASSPMLCSLWQQYDSLLIVDGVLYHKFYNEFGDVLHYQLMKLIN